MTKEFEKLEKELEKEKTITPKKKPVWESPK